MMETGVPICSSCGEEVGVNGEVFVACHECNLPLCKVCMDYEVKEGRNSCFRCATPYHLHHVRALICRSWNRSSFNLAYLPCYGLDVLDDVCRPPMHRSICWWITWENGALQKSAQAGPITCGKPILRSNTTSLCVAHFQKSLKDVTRALRKAGLNVSSSSKLAPRFYIIVSQFVHQIHANRRAAAERAI